MPRYKNWTTKDGEKIPINKMTDTHLINTIAILERRAKEETQEAISLGWQTLACLSGEMATYHVESELDYLMEHGLCPGEVNHLYEDLVNERHRRGLDIQDKEY